MHPATLCVAVDSSNNTAMGVPSICPSPGPGAPLFGHHREGVGIGRLDDRDGWEGRERSDGTCIRTDATCIVRCTARPTSHMGGPRSTGNEIIGTTREAQPAVGQGRVMRAERVESLPLWGIVLPASDHP